MAGFSPIEFLLIREVANSHLPFSAFPVFSIRLNAACADVQLRLKNESQQTT
jgi:hypothetical protein